MTGCVPCCWSSPPSCSRTVDTKQVTFTDAGSPSGDVAGFRCSLSSAGFSVPDGTWTFEVAAVDAAGNVDRTPAKQELTVDTTAAAEVTGSTAVLRFSGTPAADVARSSAAWAPTRSRPAPAASAATTARC